MTYQQQQHELMDSIERQFKNGQTPSTIVEPVADYANDPRIYLTSIVHLPSTAQKAVIQQLSQPLKAVCPSIYFIQPKALHLTIVSIRLFKTAEFFDAATLERIKAVFARVIPQHKTIAFELKGLLRLPTSLGLRCYSDSKFGDLVKHLRKELESIGIVTDKKLASDEIFFSNVTVCRFVKTIDNTKVIEATEKFNHINLGKIVASKISLVTTNAVAAPQLTKLLGEYNLS